MTAPKQKARPTRHREAALTSAKKPDPVAGAVAAGKAIVARAEALSETFAKIRNDMARAGVPIIAQRDAEAADTVRRERAAATTTQAANETRWPRQGRPSAG